MTRLVLILLTAMLTALLASCSTNSHLVTGQTRPPVDPAQVRVYFTPPPGGFEEIAQLETSSGSFTYGEQNKMNSVITKLKAEAAKLGANGVLFIGTENSYGNSSIGVGAGGGNYGGSGFSSGGVGFSISPTQKFARGLAIYVPNPPPEAPAPATAPQPAPTPTK
ncbi:hypothetical protein [Lysobacter niastensis]|uniref:DUF4156 domain-containing protein n=1 Tax=Lysobacter niastensis TaxID=380629 RepID=A0ABS0B4I3_9GAMM|nr:hypothetical protein [Lysobacter niastensis]MBF6023378.1 hypothetical protein [Lysobacter niastensis]